MTVIICKLSLPNPSLMKYEMGDVPSLAINTAVWYPRPAYQTSRDVVKLSELEFKEIKNVKESSLPRSTLGFLAVTSETGFYHIVKGLPHC